MKVFIISLRHAGAARKSNIERSKSILKDVEVFDAVNGYDPLSVLEDLMHSPLSFHQLEQQFQTYGTLACFLSKYQCLQEQIERKLDFMCMLEDDVQIPEDCQKYLDEQVEWFKSQQAQDCPVALVRLGKWGEAYLSSYEGAHHIIRELESMGIVANIDNQLNKLTSCVASKFGSFKYDLVVPTNGGDISKTRKLKNETLKLLTSKSMKDKWRQDFKDESLENFIFSLQLNGIEGNVSCNTDKTKAMREIVANMERKSDNLFQIGFNAGHSADLFLKDSQSTLCSVDIGTHEYVDICNFFITLKYQRLDGTTRHTLVIGDSTVAVPAMQRDKQFDLIFIDGGHALEIAQQDIANCRRLAKDGSILLVDDVISTRAEWHRPWTTGPSLAYQEAIDQGKIEHCASFDCEAGQGFVLGRYVRGSVSTSAKSN